MGPARPILVTALVALALLSGCGGEARDATAKELSALTAQISKLRAEQASMAGRLDALERAQTPDRPAAPAVADAKPADSPPPVAARPLDADRPSLDVVKLGPPAEDEGDGDADDDGPRTVLRSGASGIIVEEATGPTGSARTAAPDAKKPTSKKTDKADRKKTAASPKL